MFGRFFSSQTEPATPDKVTASHANELTGQAMAQTTVNNKMRTDSAAMLLEVHSQSLLRHDKMMAQEKETHEAMLAQQKETREAMMARNKETSEAMMARNKETSEAMMAREKETHEAILAHQKETREAMLAQEDEMYSKMNTSISELNTSMTQESLAQWKAVGDARAVVNSMNDVTGEDAVEHLETYDPDSLVRLLVPI